MSTEWTITRLRGGLAVAFYRDGKRHRHSLATSDPREAQRLAPAVYAELTRPQGRKVSDLWEAYRLDKAAKSIATTMAFTGKAILPHFGHRDGEDVTKTECAAYTASRRKLGRSDGAIHTELGHLRTVLVWARKNRLINFAPDIEKPKKPEPKYRYLTKDEVKRMLAAVKLPHVKLAIHAMLATGARISALLELTWDRVDFERRRIYLTDPTDPNARKGRATVPINDTLLAVLKEARKGALTDYVVEWAGERVGSVKKAIGTAATKAGLEGVSPHVFRHTTGVWMAEAGIPMAEIGQYLGHSNLAVTYRVYARFSPGYLSNAARAMDLGIYEVLPGSPAPAIANAG